MSIGPVSLTVVYCRVSSTVGQIGGELSPAPVLRLIIGAVGSILLLDRPPPPFVPAVPRDRFVKPRVERDARLPSEGTQLGRVEAITAIVAGSICDRSYQ